MTETQALFMKNLKNYRRIKKFSQAALAQACCLTSNYIAEMEAGRRFPSHETLQALSDALDVRPYQFFMSEFSDYIWLEAKEELDHKKQLIISKLRSLISELE